MTVQMKLVLSDKVFGYDNRTASVRGLDLAGPSLAAQLGRDGLRFQPLYARAGHGRTRRFRTCLGHPLA